MATNKRNFITTITDMVSASYDTYFFRTSQFDIGGRVDVYNDSYISSRMYAKGEDYSKYHCAVGMAASTRLTLGGICPDAYRDTGLVVKYEFTREECSEQYFGTNAAIRFKGSGELAVSTSTGAGQFGNHESNGVRSISVSKSIGVLGTESREEKLSVTYTWCSVVGVEAIAGLTVIGDAALNITATSECCISPWYYSGSDWKYYLQDIEALAFGYRASNITVTQKMEGTITASSSAVIKADGLGTFNTTVSGNRLGAFGISATETLSLLGSWSLYDNAETGTTGNIPAIIVTAKTLVLDPTGYLKDPGFVATDNHFEAIGVYAENVLLNNVGLVYRDTDGSSKTLAGASISVTLDDVQINLPDNTSIHGSSANVIAAVGIQATNLTLTGRFAPDIFITAKDLIDVIMSSKIYCSDNHVYINGIHATTITSTENLNGTITITAKENTYSETMKKTYQFDYDLAGISATTLTVNGKIATSISYVGEYGSGILVSGVLTASCLESTISIKAETLSIDGKTGCRYGVQATSLQNNDDGIFDITGDITVNGIDGIALSLSPGKDTKLRVSGTISASAQNGCSYAIQIKASGVTNNIEFAAGSVITGNIDRTSQGVNFVLTVDSNARFTGELDGNRSKEYGTLEINYVLNEHTLTGEVVGKNTAILTDTNYGAQYQLGSTTSISVDMNNAGTGTYILFEAQGSLETSLAQRTISFSYQGITKDMLKNASDWNKLYSRGILVDSRGIHGTLTVDTSKEVSTVDTSKEVSTSDPTLKVELKNGEYFTVSVGLSSDKTQLLYNVISLPSNAHYELTELGNLKTDAESKVGSVTVSWDVTSSSYDVMYELEYRIVGDESKGRTVVIEIDGDLEKSCTTETTAGKRISFTIDNVTAAQSVEWRVRQSAIDKALVSEWSETQTADGSEAHSYYIGTIAETSVTLDMYTGSTPTAVLNWSQVSACSEGFDHYEIQYFWSNSPLYGQDLANAWLDEDNIIIKESTANSLLISSLPDQNYLYWRVRAVDQLGQTATDEDKNEIWTDGKTFQIDSSYALPYFKDATNKSLTVDENKKFIAEYETRQGWEGAYAPIITINTQASSDTSKIVAYKLVLKDNTGKETVYVINADQDDGGTNYFSINGTSLVYDTEAVWQKYGSAAPLKGITDQDYTWTVYAVDYLGRTSTTSISCETEGEDDGPYFNDTSLKVTSTYRWISEEYKTDYPWVVSVKFSAAKLLNVEEPISYYLISYENTSSSKKSDKGTFKVYAADLEKSGYVFTPGQNFLNESYTWTVQAVDVRSVVSKNTLTASQTADHSAPVFSGSDAKVTCGTPDSETGVPLTFQWDAAEDRGGSILTKYVLSIKGETDEDYKDFWTLSIDDKYPVPNNVTFYLKQGKLWSRTLDDKGEAVFNEVMQMLGGTYSWKITAYDGFDNASAITSSFDVVTTAPTGSFTSSTAPVFTVEYDLQPSGNPEGWVIFWPEAESETATVVFSGEQDSDSKKVSETISVTGTQPDYRSAATSATLTLSVNGSFTSKATVYYRFEFANNKDFAGTIVKYQTTITSLTLTNESEFKIGELLKLNAETIYYRVIALDSFGNEIGSDLYYTSAIPIYLTDGKNLSSYEELIEGTEDDPQYKTVYTSQGKAITDEDTPVFDEKTTITVKDGSISWTAATDVFGVEYYTVTLTPTTGSIGTTWVGTTTTNSISNSNFTGLAEGTYTCTVSATDFAGHTAAFQEKQESVTTIYYDRSAPVFDQDSIKLVKNGGSGSSVSYTLTWTAASDAVSGLAGYVLYLSPNGVDNITNTEYNVSSKNLENSSCAITGTSYTFTAPENYQYCLVAMDRMGNYSTGEFKMLSMNTGTARITDIRVGNFYGTGESGVFELLDDGTAIYRSSKIQTAVGTLENPDDWEILDVGDFNGSGHDGLLWLEKKTGNVYMQYDMSSLYEINYKKHCLGTVTEGYEVRGAGDFVGNGIDGALLQSPAFGDASVSTNYGLPVWARNADGSTFVGWLGALVNTWQKGDRLKGDLSSPESINANNYRYEVVTIGDFNGDGRDDVMLQNTMPTTVTQDGVSYTITGSGDVFVFLTGEKEDIILGTAPEVVYSGKATGGWEILGTGDFDADGIDDVLLTDGTSFAAWKMSNGKMQEVFDFSNLYDTDGQIWNLTLDASTKDAFSGIADFDGNGTDDILIRGIVEDIDDVNRNIKICYSTEELCALTVKDGKVTGLLAMV